VGNPVRDVPTLALSVTSAEDSIVSSFVPSPDTSLPSTLPDTTIFPVTVAPVAVASTLVLPAF
jgi:hypothetical protein